MTKELKAVTAFASVASWQEALDPLQIECHPDAPNGSHDKWLELSEAWEAARQELGA